MVISVCIARLDIRLHVLYGVSWTENQRGWNTFKAEFNETKKEPNKTHNSGTISPKKHTT